MRKRSSSSTVCRTTVRLLVDALRLVSLGLRSRSHLAAENLFLRKQLALYQERRVKPRRADDSIRITLVMLSQLIDWRAVLTIVKPDTLIRWHRKGFRLFWRWKSRAPGRPRLPLDVQRLIAAMARANAMWGEERIAAELAPRTARHRGPRANSRKGVRPVRFAPRRRPPSAGTAGLRGSAASLSPRDGSVSATTPSLAPAEVGPPTGATRPRPSAPRTAVPALRTQAGAIEIPIPWMRNRGCSR
jgi:hypothetical protein